MRVSLPCVEGGRRGKAKRQEKWTKRRMEKKERIKDFSDHSGN